jgi:hypothetical protein
MAEAPEAVDAIEQWPALSTAVLACVSAMPWAALAPTSLGGADASAAAVLHERLLSAPLAHGSPLLVAHCLYSLARRDYDDVRRLSAHAPAPHGLCHARRPAAAGDGEPAADAACSSPPSRTHARASTEATEQGTPRSEWPMVALLRRVIGASPALAEVVRHGAADELRYRTCAQPHLWPCVDEVVALVRATSGGEHALSEAPATLSGCRKRKHPEGGPEPFGKRCSA